MIKKFTARRLISVCLILAGLWMVFINGRPLLLEGDSLSSDPIKQIPKKNEVKKIESPLYSIRPKAGEQFGELYIPKIEKRLPIVQGANEDELEKGVGHFVGSVLPGEDDNSVLSGHRDTVFRQLGKVGKGDLLIITTIAGEFTYKVNRVRIVDADNRTVIVPKPRATLTLTTCYPFTYIGNAPKRYILIANLVYKKLRVSTATRNFK
jgi:sortase A